MLFSALNEYFHKISKIPAFKCYSTQNHNFIPEGLTICTANVTIYGHTSDWKRGTPNATLSSFDKFDVTHIRQLTCSYP